MFPHPFHTFLTRLDSRVLMKRCSFQTFLVSSFIVPFRVSGSQDQDVPGTELKILLFCNGVEVVVSDSNSSWDFVLDIVSFSICLIVNEHSSCCNATRFAPFCS